MNEIIFLGVLLSLIGFLILPYFLLLYNGTQFNRRFGIVSSASSVLIGLIVLSLYQ